MRKVGDLADLADEIGDCETLYYEKFVKNQVIELWYEEGRSDWCVAI